MNKRLFSRLLLFSFLIVELLGGAVMPVSASSMAKTKVRIRTAIALDDLNAVNLGESFTVAGNIKDAYDRPIVGKSILFTIGDQYLGQARSDENGHFERKFKNELNAGTYELTATSKITTSLAATTSSITLKVLPAEVQIQTVPAIAGVSFQMNGETFFSDSKGFASIKIDKAGKYRLNVLTDKYSNPSQKIEFGRWLEESYKPFQDIQVPADGVIQVGLNVYQLVGQSFVDLDGNPVDPARVTKFTIRSIQGDVFEFTDGQPRWIPASRIARRVNGLEESKLLYSVIEVMVDGSNVVNKSQQRFYTHPGDNWEISLLFYTMHVDARDGLFGNKLGKSVNLEFPDGSVKNYPLKNGVAEITSLPRGIYTIEFVGIKGMSNRTPVALSRDQDVHTKVITYLDMVVVGLLGIFVALGMLLYGRPKLLRGLLGKKQPVLQPSFASTNQLALVESNPLQGGGLQIFRFEETLGLEARAFKQLTGVGRESFENMLASLRRAWGSPSKNAKMSRADQLMLTLISLKGEQSITQLGEAYDVSETTVRRTIKKVRATLATLDDLNPSIEETPLSERIFVEKKETLLGERIFIEKVVRRELDRLGNEILRIEWPVSEEKVINGQSRSDKRVFIEEFVMDDPDSQPMSLLVDSLNHPVEAVYEK
jgi:hypothetical protein